MGPAVVTCMTSTRKSASGRPLLASDKMNQELPMKSLTLSSEAPFEEKKGVTFVSPTSVGSEAPEMPERLAGPSRPMVANESSTRSGNVGTKTGLMPEAFHEVLAVLLKAPSGVITVKGSSWLPKIALTRSVTFWSWM